ncbi:Uncharacterised protein [Salmonella enterica subsp. enterica serovar Bovismorbificans]|nr:Uncharacterised protein [Salmonella enterica subsp. enterica serovar Bovismorbificans]
MGFFNILDQVIDAQIIKAHPIDQTFSIHQTKKTRLIVTRLWARRHGADFQGAKPHRA